MDSTDMIGIAVGSSLRPDGSESLAVSSACPEARLETLARGWPNPTDRLPDRRTQASRDPRDRHGRSVHPQKGWPGTECENASDNGQNKCHFVSKIDAPEAVRLLPGLPDDPAHSEAANARRRARASMILISSSA